MHTETDKRKTDETPKRKVWEEPKLIELDAGMEDVWAAIGVLPDGSAGSAPSS